MSKVPRRSRSVVRAAMKAAAAKEPTAANLGLRNRAAPGTAPGIESMAGRDQPPAPGTVEICCIDYGIEGCVETRGDNLAEAVPPRGANCRVRWINVDGLHPYVVSQLRERFPIHTLAAEDILRTTQRPKVEAYDEHLFLVLRMVMLRDGVLHHEQVSILLFKDTVITFQETHGDVWDPIRSRLTKPDSRFRRMEASYLLYALVDAVVDHGFPILETYGEELDELEDAVTLDPSAAIRHRVHDLRHDLSGLRRIMWPLREITTELQRDDSHWIDPHVKTYVRDVYDHAIHVMEILESHREQAAGVIDLYNAAIANRMNEIMKVLTIMASFFIPITFFAGVYGMNFEHIPELSWQYGYAGFWLVCLGASAGLAFFFWRRGWIGRG